MGAGGGMRHVGVPDTGVSYVLVDFDEWPEADGTAILRAMGLRTVLEPGSADLGVITSRLRGLWERWSGDLLAEARRIGGSVRVAFSEGDGPR